MTLTDADLDAIEQRAKAYLDASSWSLADTIGDEVTRTDVPALLAEVRRLRALLADRERSTP